MNKNNVKAAITVAYLQDQLRRMVNIAHTGFGLTFSSTPLTKNLVMVMGDQSSGKSSFINHLFGNLPLRQTGPNAIDTSFTLIETVCEEEFIQICGAEKYRDVDAFRNFTSKEQYENWLFKPIDSSGSSIKTDDRKYSVFVELQLHQKMNRYRQFYESQMRETFIKYKDTIKAIIVNEKFVHGTDLEKMRWREKEVERAQQHQYQQEEYVEQSVMQQQYHHQQAHGGEDVYYPLATHAKTEEDVGEESSFVVVDEAAVDTHLIPADKHGRSIVKDLIIIDTPGFNDEASIDVEQFKANVDILEFFYKQSAQCFFMVSSDHMLSLGSSLNMLQLTLLERETKLKVFEQAASQIKKQQSEQVQQDQQPQSMFSIGYLSSLLVTGMYSAFRDQVSTTIGLVAPVVTNLMTPKSNVQFKYFGGTSIFDKLYFIINKIDLCVSVEYAFYELGCSIARKFQYLPSPPAHHILIVGIPWEQHLHRCFHNNKQQASAASFAPSTTFQSAVSQSKSLFHSYSVQNYKTGKLDQVEMLLDSLRDESHTNNIIIAHIQYIYEKIQNEYQSVGYIAAMWSKSKLYEQAKEIANSLDV